MSELGRKTKELYKEDFNFTLTVGVGNIYDSLFMVNQSFAEANRAALYRFVKGNNQIILFRYVEKEQKKKYRYLAGEEEQLLISLLSIII